MARLLQRLEWVWSGHLWFAILLGDNMDLRMSSLCILPEGPSCMFYATRWQVYLGLKYMVFYWYSDLISHTHTHTHTHTETDFRIKNLLSWQNILSKRQIAADIEEKWDNQGEVTHTQTHTHTHTHTQGLVDWQTHINIYLHHLLCAHSNYLYYITWLND